MTGDKNEHENVTLQQDLARVENLLERQRNSPDWVRRATSAETILIERKEQLVRELNEASAD